MTIEYTFQYQWPNEIFRDRIFGFVILKKKKKILSIHIEVIIE
jgi:hypothetical protein